MCAAKTEGKVMQIAFIGAGMMGYGIALNLMKAGHALRVLAHQNREPIEKLLSRGAEEAPGYPELLAGAEAVFTCVGTAEQLESVFNEAEPHLSGASLWIDCTTSRPGLAKQLARRLIPKGAGFIDAPVTRAPKDAEAGRLVSLVGAEPGDYERALPLIQAYSETVNRMGPVGSGLQAKLINNFITMGQTALVVEAMHAADAAGIERGVLYELLVQGAANSGTLRKMVPPSLKGDFSGHAFSLGNGAKDVKYSSELVQGRDGGRLLVEALSKYYNLHLEKHPKQTLLGELLKP
jgi:3-hydroxyisobutyrate dehydrogenase-like beta-hydroxyacid dehydrogenase